MRNFYSILAWVASATLALGTIASAEPVFSYPGPFSQIESCAPVAVKVSTADPADPKPHAVSVEAEQAVQDALKATVTPAGTLQLTSDGDFATSKPIEVVVTLPASELQGVAVKGAGDVLVGPGFITSQQLSLAVSGSASLVVREVTAPALKISKLGTGVMVVGGEIGAVTVQASGTGDVYLSGVSSEVTVQGSGIGSVVVEAASPAVQILGSFNGIGKVYYNQGQCGVTSPFSQAFTSPGLMGPFGPPMPSPLGTPCQQTPQVSAPANNPRWTCGLEVEGIFDCNDGAFSSSSGSISGGGGATSFTLASTAGERSAGDSAFEEPVVTAFDNGPNTATVTLDGPGSVQVSSTGQGTARSIECTAGPRALRMM